MNNKRVLVAPLDWGLGHATRCIPVIRELLDQHCEVQIGGAGKSLQILKDEFPELTFYDLPAYAPLYPARGSMFWKLAGQLPKFMKAIRQEHIAVSEIVKNERIGLVISDNRYGAWSPAVPSIFLTHQLNIVPPKGGRWIRPLLRLINYQRIKNFSACWVPDLPDRKLTGDLSKPFKKIPTTYIGMLSRFKLPEFTEPTYDILVILSGPEPQRTLLEDRVLEQLKDYNRKILLVRGLVGENARTFSHAQVTIVNSLDTDELQQAIAMSRVVIARSGYSTIMDLSIFQSKSILIPTPGQTEQLYLANRLYRKGIIFSVTQQDFQIQPAFLKATKLKRPFPENDPTLLGKAIKNLLSNHEEV